VEILIVEDDPAIALALESAFAAQGESVQRTDSVAEVLRLVAAPTLDALILDLGLPDGDGLEVLRRARARPVPLPTVIMSARDALHERIGGLDAGADDYIVKPFEFAELLARLRAVLRRSGALRGVERFGALERGPDDARYFHAGAPLLLSPREQAILDLLWARRERLVGKQDLLQAVDPLGTEIADSTLDVYVHRLRRKLDGCAVSINTLRGFGYLLQAD
jgi:two-component system, OmpR family, response regulator